MIRTEGDSQGSLWRKYYTHRRSDVLFSSARGLYERVQLALGGGGGGGGGALIILTACH